MNNRTPTAKVLRTARDLVADTRDVARNGASQAKSFIHQRPVLSILLGLGLGVLIGHWLRPREQTFGWKFRSISNVRGDSCSDGQWLSS